MNGGPVLARRFFVCEGIMAKEGQAEEARSRSSEIDALKSAAALAIRSGKPSIAVQNLRRVVALDNQDASAWLNLAASLRAVSEPAAAIDAVNSAIALNPRHFLALLLKGSLEEQQGERHKAARTYGAALTQLPPDDRMDEPTRRAVIKARSVHHAYTTELQSFVLQEVGLGDPSANSEARKVSLFVDAILGKRRIFRQQPTAFEFPGLPAIEFYERSEFAWLSTLEAATPVFQRELAKVMAHDEGFEPYVAYPDGAPLDQWQDLNRSRRWTAFHFYHYGRRYPANCGRCPETVALLAQLPQPQVAGRMPAAMFSVLRANTRIPPHTGVANVRLVVHLPLVVPPGCGFRVGNETREWKVGEAWVFDDTIEHEAWNDSDEDRVVLIFDIWNPRLSASERSMIAEVMSAMDRFNEVSLSPEPQL